jgi:hypothetical protein
VNVDFLFLFIKQESESSESSNKDCESMISKFGKKDLTIFGEMVVGSNFRRSKVVFSVDHHNFSIFFSEG